MKGLVKYLKDMFNLDVAIFPLEKSQQQSLPLFITASYNTYETNVSGQRICLMTLRNEENKTPDQLAKQMAFVERTIGLPVVFVFEKVASYNLKRLVQKKVNFIIPGKQLYIPALIMNLRKVSDQSEKKAIRITPVAQFLLLYHLQKETLSGQTTQQLAERFSLTYITLSRAVKNMEELKLCNLAGGKEKQLQFNEKGKNLWEKAQQFLQLPVERTIFTDKTLDTDIACASGINALAYYTMLSDEERKHYAIDKRNVANVSVATDKHNGDNVIEIWRYDPKLLSGNGIVDKLSLYLLFKDNIDERIQGELDQMMEEIKWLEE
jgi:DNA-binding MarR family transcriptional regulator